MEVVGILLSLVLALSTVAYTFINYYIYNESKELRKQKTTPLIISYLKFSENHQSLILCIKNIGEGLAKNVKIKLNEDFNRFDMEDLLLSECGIFKEGFSLFPPQYELHFSLMFIDQIKLNIEKTIKLSICYENNIEETFYNEYTLSINQVMGQGYNKPPDSYVGQIPYYLNEIKKLLEKRLK